MTVLTPPQPAPANRWRLLIWIAAALLLVAPAIAMRFFPQVTWSSGDFIVWGAMLLTGCALYEVAARISRNPGQRLAAALALGGAFVMVWVNLAVGIVGDGANPINLAYFALLGAGLAGAVLLRFRPGAMVRVMQAMALGQLGIVVAIAITAPVQPPAIWIFNTLFVLLWVVAGWLFGRGR